MIASSLFTDVQWILIALLALLALTAVLSVSFHAVLAIAHDTLPYLLGLAWIILVFAIIDGAWIRAAAALVLVIYHLAMLVPRFLRDRVPRWAAGAPQVQMLVCNVYTENATPALLAEEMLAADADVMVILEWNPTFAKEFDSAGAKDSYPHRLCDENDHSDYSVCIVSRVAFTQESEMKHVGPLTMAHAVILSGEQHLRIIGINPTAAVDPGGYDEWKAQIEELTEFMSTSARPVVVAGDFNTTRFRPEYKLLLKSGLTDGHDALGKGMTSSFKLSADGVLAAPGTVIRLDHALLSKGVCAVAAEDLESCGSDHLPFRMTLAVRQSRRSAAPA